MEVMKMKIEFTEGKYGKEDKIILLTSTNRDNKLIEQEAFSIFKIALVVNQLAWNELEMKSGYKRRLVKRGETLFFQEAIKEAITMAIEGINWAEENNLEKVKDWAKRNKIKIKEPIEKQLRRTFQKEINQF